MQTPPSGGQASCEFLDTERGTGGEGQRSARTLNLARMVQKRLPYVAVRRRDPSETSAPLPRGTEAGPGPCTKRSRDPRPLCTRSSRTRPRTRRRDPARSEGGRRTKLSRMSRSACTRSSRKNGGRPKEGRTRSSRNSRTGRTRPSRTVRKTLHETKSGFARGGGPDGPAGPAAPVRPSGRAETASSPRSGTGTTGSAGGEEAGSSGPPCKASPVYKHRRGRPGCPEICASAWLWGLRPLRMCVRRDGKPLRPCGGGAGICGKGIRLTAVGAGEAVRAVPGPPGGRFWRGGPEPAAMWDGRDR